MNRYYLIIPVVGLILFGFAYANHRKIAQEQERVVAARVAQEKADEENKKHLAEEKARQDAEHRAQEREADEKKKAAEKRAKYDADIQKIRDDIAKYTGQVNDSGKQSAKLDQDLTNLRANKDKANREAFDLHKQVERAQIDRRNAEFEIQRLTDMIVHRASESDMARMPAVAAATEKK